MTDALLLCPLCGMKPEAVSNREKPPLDYLYRCPRCRLETQQHDDSLIDAVARWNRAVEQDKLSSFCIRMFI